MGQKFLVLLAIVAVTCWAGVAAADDISFNLTTGDSVLSAYPAPYAGVQVTLSGSTATITFTADTNYLIGGDPQTNYPAIGLEVNGSFTVTGVASNNGTFTSDSSGSLDSSNGNPFGGTFNLLIDDNSDTLLGAASTVTITLTGSWSSSSNVLVNNSAGYSAAANIFVVDCPEGIAAGDIVVPLPPTALLLGTGLVGLVGLGWKRRRAG